MPPKLKFILFIFAACTLLAASFLLPFGEYVQALMHTLESIGVWGLFALSLFYIVACVLFVPGSLLTLGAGFLAAASWPDNFALALFWGTVAVSFGSVSGASAAFWVGRTFARTWVEERVGTSQKFRALDEAIAREGFKMVLLVRLSPVFPFNILNYALGLTKVRFRDYLLASWLGMLPGTIMYVYLGMGAQNMAALAGGTSDAASASTQALRVLGLLATIVVVYFATRTARRALAAAENDIPNTSSNHSEKAG